MCLSCGYYKGRQVLDLATLKTDREARIKAKRAMSSVDAGATAPVADEKAADTANEEKGVKVAKKSRATKTGASSKKAKQETA
jgi:hypothetical protein